MELMVNNDFAIWLYIVFNDSKAASPSTVHFIFFI